MSNETRSGDLMDYFSWFPRIVARPNKNDTLHRYPTIKELEHYHVPI
jgi:hypothetical protein